MINLPNTVWASSPNTHWRLLIDGGAPGGPASVCAGGPQQAGAGQLSSAEPGTNEGRRGGQRETAQSAQRAAGQRQQDEPVTETTQRQRDPTGLWMILSRFMCYWTIVRDQCSVSVQSLDTLSPSLQWKSVSILLTGTVSYLSSYCCILKLEYPLNQSILVV